jgi:4-hydroxybutyrate CoA-transferase
MGIGKNWKNDYQNKLVSAEEAARAIQSGDIIYTPPANSIPIDVLNALCKRRDEVKDVQIYTSLITYPFEFFKGEYAGHITCHSNYMGPLERMFQPEGNVVACPIHLSQSERAINVIGDPGPDVFMCEVTPPDERGFMNFGPCGTICGRFTAKYSPKVIVQVNRKTPWVHGEENIIHVSNVDYIVEGDHDLTPIPEIAITETEKKIGALIAERIPDGATIQLGIGGIPNAVAYFLMEKKDLGVHAEILSDAVVSLVEKGVINGSRKTLHKDKIVVGGIILGTQKLYDFVDNNPVIASMPISYVNSINVIAANDNLASINAGLTVDLSGQVASESIGHVQYSATGGQADFVRGALQSKNGQSFIALKSSSRNKEGLLTSRIQLNFKPGTIVTTVRSDVMYIVTEYGIADLYLKPVPTRVKAMISIAHPDFREQLEREAIEVGLLPKCVFASGFTREEKQVTIKK